MDTPHRAPAADIAADMTDRSRTRRTAGRQHLAGVPRSAPRRLRRGRRFGWERGPVRALVQRVRGASVSIDGQTVGAIGIGLVVLVGVTHTDTSAEAAQLARKVHEVRLLRDEQSIADVTDSAVLVVSQFTLYGDGRKGRRPTWAAAAGRDAAEPLVETFVSALRARGARVATGMFGGDMRLSLVNDGPVTLLLEV